MKSQEKILIGSIGEYIRQSVTLKLLSILFLMLVLMIPVSLIMDLITERDAMRQSAINEVSGKWANAQHVYGPILTLPVTRQVAGDGIERQVREEAHILPSLLRIGGEVEPRSLHRGIYEVVVYDSRLSFEGNFEEIGKYIAELNDYEVLWDEAFLTISISDLRGIKQKVEVNWDGEVIPVEPGSLIPGLVNSGITVNNVLDGVPVNEGYPFSFNIHLQGSSHLGVIPLGKETFVRLSSSWHTPSFSGSFLPDERIVNEEGFVANYKIIEINRNYPQFWIGNLNTASIQSSAFGVDLLLPANDYQKAMRSAKYALLIIFLTFLTFFLVEIFNKRSIHPFQYLLVGMALVLFYILLISVSEHTSFNTAYLIAGTLVILITGLYAKPVLGSVKQAVVLVVVMAFTYSFIFIVLQVQDYALLIGSGGLTAILAVTMYLTRNINWYEVGAIKKNEAAKG